MIELCKQVLINAKLQFAKRCQKTELTGRNPVWWRRAALDCSAIEEETEEEEEKRRNITL
jgi:hypothetical protein